MRCGARVPAGWNTTVKPFKWTAELFVLNHLSSHRIKLIEHEQLRAIIVRSPAFVHGGGLVELTKGKARYY